MKKIIMLTKSGVKPKRVVLSATNKLDIVKQLGSDSKVSEQYNIGQQTITGIKLQKRELMKFNDSQSKKSDLHKTMKSCETEEINKVL